MQERYEPTKLICTVTLTINSPKYPIKEDPGNNDKLLQQQSQVQTMPPGHHSRRLSRSGHEPVSFDLRVGIVSSSCITRTGRISILSSSETARQQQQATRPTSPPSNGSPITPSLLATWSR
mmetsp:Transcript_31039/g.64347  ORF Transcript_31039/g.64347 Transcript_31039/m.64347 type:complete len:121 (-) Transcript_31039:65-427(-)